ncbi:MAG: hypothetical protein QG607_182 [Patescibacteria group bacterium]|nr:hypothetical protein [Patescibacteria group bacterium]
MQSNTSKIVLAIIIITIIVGGGAYYWQNSQTITEPDITTQSPSISSDLETYSSEKYSFQYPKGYFVVADSSGIILTVRKAANQQEADTLGRDATKNRLEIFQMKDFGGDRPWGIENEASQEEIDGYVAKETLTVGSGDKKLDVWLYYSKNDSQTKKELKAIFDSIVVK